MPQQEFVILSSYCGSILNIMIGIHIFLLKSFGLDDMIGPWFVQTRASLGDGGGP